MIDIKTEYDFDLERVIKCSKNKSNSNRKRVANTGANYILDKFTQKLLELDFEITKKDLQETLIKTVETTTSKTKKVDGTKIKRKKVIKQYYLAPKEKLEMIRQVIEYTSTNGKKSFNTETSIATRHDLIEEKIYNRDGLINRNNQIVKKLKLV